MGMTMTQKILAAHAGLDHVEAGQFIEAKLDAVLANDITGPVAIRNLPAMGADKVFNPDRVYLIPDHFTPNKDIKAADKRAAKESCNGKVFVETCWPDGHSGVHRNAPYFLPCRYGPRRHSNQCSRY